MRFSDNRNLYIRRGLFTLLFFLTAAVQHTAGVIPAVFGAKAMVLIPLTVAVAVHEKSMAGLAFGVLAGALWDFASVRGDGFFAVVLAAVGFLCSSAVTYLMRKNILTALILTGGAVGLTNVVYWLLFIQHKGYEGAASVLFTFYLPSALYSLLFIFLYYYLVAFIVKLTEKKQRQTY